MLQCGDPTGTGAGGPGYSFADELEGTETYGRGHARHGQRRAQHQRLAVLHGLRRLTAAGRLHGLRHDRRRRASRCSTKIAARGRRGRRRRRCPQAAGRGSPRSRSADRRRGPAQAEGHPAELLRARPQRPGQVGVDRAAAAPDADRPAAHLAQPVRARGRCCRARPSWRRTASAARPAAGSCRPGRGPTSRRGDPAVAAAGGDPVAVLPGWAPVARSVEPAAVSRRCSSARKSMLASLDAP